MVVDGTEKASCLLHSFDLLTIDSCPAPLVLSRGECSTRRLGLVAFFFAQPQSSRTVREFRIPLQLIVRRRLVFSHR